MALSFISRHRLIFIGVLVLYLCVFTVTYNIFETYYFNNDNPQTDNNNNNNNNNTKNGQQSNKPPPSNSTNKRYVIEGVISSRPYVRIRKWNDLPRPFPYLQQRVSALQSTWIKAIEEANFGEYNPKAYPNSNDNNINNHNNKKNPSRQNNDNNNNNNNNNKNDKNPNYSRKKQVSIVLGLSITGRMRGVTGTPQGRIYSNYGKSLDKYSDSNQGNYDYIYIIIIANV